MTQTMKTKTLHTAFSKSEHIEAFIGKAANQRLTCSMIFQIGKVETWSVSIYEVSNFETKYVGRKLVCLTESKTGYLMVEQPQVENSDL